ncbi:Glutamine synthetase [Klebsormidium nitens]|uniref:glutamine synthetase n=1 Tax=Klebsormidium nitens TaxID=105231 RepID=A0A1Y1HHA6_KLENI|nr:Glutamine synthetase [Klebsormidium nitens]|eukprot:GAQ77825.1 Glutamine synthetase [Klebsormidium nitens]
MASSVAARASTSALGLARAGCAEKGAVRQNAVPVRASGLTSQFSGVKIAESFGRSSSFTRNEVAAEVSAKSAQGKRTVATRAQGPVVAELAQRAEYIWSDGAEGTKGIKFNELRAKTKVIPKAITTNNPKDFPQWSFDGSSTGQAEGHFSDCILNPVYVTNDPIRGGNNVLVLCEVLTPQGEPHSTNTRRKIADLLTPEVLAEETLFGFEQEYTMLSKTGQIYGWPANGFPEPQGPFYCGVGQESVYGRPLAEAHMDACIKAGLRISGINAEVMPGQWEFQIGPAGPLEVGDHVQIARWLLNRLGEDYGITITLEPKPIQGDWNGTGAHTNYSTKSMREEGGIKAIHEAIEKLSKKHREHIMVYGIGNEKRLTGKHETANIDTFRSGVSDRGASIRIPLGVSIEGKGYLEDRRPAANVDPYVVAGKLIETTLAK